MEISSPAPINSSKNKERVYQNRTHRASLCLLLCLSSCFSLSLSAQFKVGDNARSLNSDAMLEIESVSKGLLLPRLALRSTTQTEPLRSFTSGMLVYNTATLNDVTPGLYICDGSRWIKVSTPTVSSDSTSMQNSFWSLRGNGTITPNQFIGSTNNAPVIVKTNNNERMRIAENGWVGIGTATPKATLQVKGQLIIDSLNSGNTATDKLLVANPADGRVKMLSGSSLLTGVQNTVQTVATNGQLVFQTPAPITDPNKIFLYRNGVLILCTPNNSNSILSEIPCKQGDQIRIIQLL